MNAKRQHLPPQALAGTRRQGRNTSGAPKMEKASQRDHRRPVLLHSCEAEHKRDRSAQKGTGEYIKADRSWTSTNQDMLAFPAVDPERLRRSEVHTFELQSPIRNSYVVFRLKQNTNHTLPTHTRS